MAGSMRKRMYGRKDNKDRGKLKNELRQMMMTNREWEKEGHGDKEKEEGSG